MTKLRPSQKKAVGTDPEAPTFSVIIPARNEAAVIGRCLEALHHLEGASFEVILVDNGSTDATREIAGRHAASLNLTILERPGVHISALRNTGAQRARGNYFAFIDADCLAPTDWLRNALGLFRGAVGVVGSHYQIPADSTWVARSWFGEHVREKQGRVAWVPAGDLVVSRHLFERLKGFDESIQTNEDCEFCERVRAAGFDVVGDPSLAVIHLGTPQTLRGLYRKTLWHATDGLRVFLKELPRITNARPLLLGLYMLICTAGLVSGIVLLPVRCHVFLSFLFLFPLPAFLLSVRLSLRRRRLSQLLPLTLLHIVYGLARAHALLLFFKNGRAPRA